MSYSFSTLRKKIDKVDSMLKDLDSSDEQFSKLQGKRDKYYEQLKQTPEWEKEGPAIERREDLRRKARQLRETANRAEKTRKEAEEARLEQERQAREAARQKMREREEVKRRAEEERLEKERLERERKEQERLKREREEQERLEQERRQRERLEQERLKREREESERIERERLEQERLERERQEKERMERERLEQERLEGERQEKERLERERLEQERLEREREEKERLERERIEQESLEREREEQEQLDRERLEQDRLEKEHEERERLERERLEEERLAREREEQERLKVEREANEQQQVQSSGGRENEKEMELDSTIDQGNPRNQLVSEVATGPDIGRSPGESDDQPGLTSTRPPNANSSVNIEPAAPPQRPMLGGMGGLLAEIGKKKKQMDGTRKPIEEKRVTTLKLVETKGRNESVADKSSLESPEAQRTESQDNETPPPLRRPMVGGMGGLLAEIGKKKEQMDAARKPIEEKRVPKLKLVDPKTVNDSSVESKSSVSGGSKLDEPANYTSRVRGDEELSEAFLQSRKSTLNLPRSANTEKILRELAATEDYHLKLEKHLKRNGIPIPADIPYEVCKDKIASITKQMQNLQATEENPYTLEKKYFELEQEMMKYSTAMMLTDEWAVEQQRLEQEWEDSVKADNVDALKRVRSHMPVNVRAMTEETLSSEPTPNGKILPQSFARKFKRTNVLQLLRVDPKDIEKMHPSYFEGMRTTGLTLTERRALHEHMKGIGAKWMKLKADKNVERKWLWFDGLKAKFKEMQSAYDQHRDDPRNRHVKADLILNYSEEDYGFPTEAVYESSSSEGTGESEVFDDVDQYSSVQAKPKKSSDEAELMAAIRGRLQLKDPESDADKKLIRELYHAEKRTRLLEKSVKQAGIEIPEDDIPYAEAKAKVAALTENIKAVAEKMMNTSDTKEAAMLEKEFGDLSSELTRYQNAMMESKEWATEQLEKEKQWEESVRESNQNALKMIRRHMPVNIRDMSEEDLVNQTTPNGKTLPLQIARKFKRTNILLLLRMDPSSIEPMHPSSLESMRTTGLTLTERRALHEHLRDLGSKWKSLSNDKMAERKWMWHDSLRSKFKDLVNVYDAYVAKFGPDGDPSMGNRCLVKADRAVDYSGDYGFPEDAEFIIDSVAKSNLLTMEDIKKRREEEEGYEEEEPANPGGFLAAIAGLGK